MKPRDQDIAALLRIGLYQLIYLRLAPHAAVHETVAAADALNKPWARGLINAVLRNFQRRGNSLLEAVDREPAVRLSHPEWLLARVQTAWPGDWWRICEANNARAPMTLRVNRRKITVEDYRTELEAVKLKSQLHPHAPDALMLDETADIAALPGFARGWVSVQDAAAQLAAPTLDCRPGMRALDACAAPGGKTAHALELTGELDLLAIDIDAARLARVAEALDRLELSARTVCADAAKPAEWWDGRPFDRILLDAPCSATGVIRRHPDIKWLRRPDDIESLRIRQYDLLLALWPLLVPGGKLLYVTCSILPEENGRQIERFASEHVDASVRVPDLAWAQQDEWGTQILPGQGDMDGFYYACMVKQR